MRYDTDLVNFIDENGKIIDFIFGNENVYRKRIDRACSGIYDVINDTNSESYLDTTLFAEKWSLILNITKLNG